MPTQEEIDEQKKLLFTHRETLAILLEQRARHTEAYTPPAIEHGIRDARANIRRVKKVLQYWGIAVDDYPNDQQVLLSKADTSHKKDQPAEFSALFGCAFVIVCLVISNTLADFLLEITHVTSRSGTIVLRLASTLIVVFLAAAVIFVSRKLDKK